MKIVNEAFEAFQNNLKNSIRKEYQAQAEEIKKLRLQKQLLK